MELQGKQKNRTRLANLRFARPASRVQRVLRLLGLFWAESFALQIAPPQ
jgi:hypothetical protein